MARQLSVRRGDILQILLELINSDHGFWWTAEQRKSQRIPVGQFGQNLCFSFSQPVGDFKPQNKAMELVIFWEPKEPDSPKKHPTSQQKKSIKQLNETVL